MDITWDMPKPSELFNEHQKLLKEECLMALRDDLAKTVMIEMLRNAGMRCIPSDVAATSYRFADAMLAERNK